MTDDGECLGGIALVEARTSGTDEVCDRTTDDDFDGGIEFDDARDEEGTILAG